jgi:hypothetical protein
VLRAVERCFRRNRAEDRRMRLVRLRDITTPWRRLLGANVSLNTPRRPDLAHGIHRIVESPASA